MKKQILRMISLIGVTVMLVSCAVSNNSADISSSIVTEWFLPKLTEYTNIPSEVKEHLPDNITYRVTATLDYQNEQYMLYVSHFVSEAR